MAAFLIKRAPSLSLCLFVSVNYDLPPMMRLLVGDVGGRIFCLEVTFFYLFDFSSSKRECSKSPANLRTKSKSGEFVVSSERNL